MTYRVFDVVRVPFPFTDSKATKRRPALILSGEAIFNTPAGHSVMAMITSKQHSTWPRDYSRYEFGLARFETLRPGGHL